MEPAERALRLIARLYDAAADASQWAPVLLEVTDAVGGAAATLLAGDTGAAPAIVVPLGITSEALRDYNNYYVRRDNRLHEALARPVGTLATHEHLRLTDSWFESTEFCNDFLKPWGLFYMAGAVLLSGPRFASLGIHRPRSSGDFEDEELRTLELLIPHLQNALRLHFRLMAAESAAGALERLSVAAIVVDDRGRIVANNHAGREVLRKGDALRSEQNLLTAANPQDDAPLRTALADAIATATAIGFGGARMLRLHRKDGSALIVSLSPMRSGPLAPWRAGAVVFASDASCVPVPPLEALREIYGLTPAEARLLSALAVGDSVREAAGRLGIREQTARTALKSVLHKTGTRRQSELIRLVTSASRVVVAKTDS